MKNLVANQHGTYTFRKRIGTDSVRISLKAADRIEAQRIYYRIQDLLLSYPALSAQETRHLLKSFISEQDSKTSQDSKAKLLSLLNSQRSPALDDPVSSLFEKHCHEKVRSGAWSPKSEKLGKEHLKILIRIVGDLPTHQLNKSTALKIKETLQRMPSNARKKRAYRDKSIQELAAVDIASSDLMSGPI